MNPRRVVSLALWMYLASVSFGSEPQRVRPPQSSPQTDPELSRKLSALEHLRIAAEQLEAAGLAEEAVKIRLVSDRLTELEKKSPRSKPLTASSNQITCSCRFLKLSTKAATEFDAAAELASPWTKRPSRTASSIAVYKNAEATIQRIRGLGRVTSILDEPQVVMTQGRPVTATTGGEFPILIPAGSDHDLSVDWRSFGTRYEVVSHLLDAGRVRLDVNVELADRDFKHAVTASGMTIPGLTMRRAHARVEVKLGETLVVGLGSNPGDDAEDSPQPSPPAVTRLANVELEIAPAEDAVTLFMVTPLAVNSLSN